MASLENLPVFGLTLILFGLSQKTEEEGKLIHSLYECSITLRANSKTKTKATKLCKPKIAHEFRGNITKRLLANYIQ
jgi:hypothetical protein